MDASFVKVRISHGIVLSSDHWHPSWEHNMKALKVTSQIGSFQLFNALEANIVPRTIRDLHVWSF